MIEQHITMAYIYTGQHPQHDIAIRTALPPSFDTLQRHNHGTSDSFEIFNPENLIYTDGSDIKGQPRLGAGVVHVPNRTTV